MPKRILSGSTNARDDLEFLMVDSSDHITGKTGLTVTVTIRKPGGSFASPSGAVSEIANGWYRVAANATDNNTTGALLLHATATGADPADVAFQVVSHDNVSTATPTVNTTQVNGTAQTAKDLGALNVTNLNTLASHDPGETIMGATDLGTGSGLTSLATATNLAAAKTVVDAIKLKTDNLPASPAATSDIPTAASVADAVWDEAQSGHVTAGTFGSYLDASVSGVSTGGVSAADIADAVWDEAMSGHTTAGTAGKALGDIDTHTDTETGAAAIRAAVGLASANLDTQLAALPTAAEITDAVLDEALSGHTTAGTLGKAVSDIDTHTDTETGAAAIRAAVGLASANLDTQLGAIQTSADAAAQPGDAMALTADALDSASLAASAGTEIAAAVQTSAATTPLPSDVKKINATTITGTGVLGDEFGPA